MKFGKEFASQMVPEWQEAYMDYNHLKAILKHILKSAASTNTTVPIMASTAKGSLKRRLTLYRAFSGLTGPRRGSPTRRSCKDDPKEEEEEEEELCQIQTVFLKSDEGGGEMELSFFRKLDDEFNKVNNFFRKKVEEAMEEAEELNKQMDALIALRVRVDEVVVGFTSTSNANEHHMTDESPSNLLPRMDVIQEVEMSAAEEQPASRTSTQGFVAPSLRILDHVKINVTAPETPVSTLKGILNMSSKYDLSFSKKELRKAEEQLSKALKEFYNKLRLLKCYTFLNLLAFSKIMKKYDKVCSRNASKDYLKMVDNSYVGSSDEVNRLMERVEAAFIKHFANGNHRKGMNTLRPTAKRERHRITFTLGLFTGCSIALIVALIVIIHARQILDSLNMEGRAIYMENIFPLYSFFGYIVLHMLMYSANIYFWKRFKINYTFIFGFKQGTELGYREVLLLSSGLSVLSWAAVLSNLDMEMDKRTKSFSTLTELVPLGLLVVLLLITFCPFNIIYKSSRFFLIQCAFHCICAPFYKVTLPDNFLADQLTSQVQAFRSLEFYVCYYFWGNFTTRSNKCLESEVYKILYYVVAIIPFWIRFVQCLRRLLLEERNVKHGLNAIKHLSTVVAIVMRTSNEFNRGQIMIWRILAAASSGFATIANTYWDIVIDWGLLQRNSTNPWLRDKLSVSNKSVYFAAMVLNVLLRLAWMQSVLGIRQAPFLHKTALIALVACLEIIRRGIWNFFRLENEHLNNVGRYRAVKSVPLPFNYEDDQDSRAEGHYIGYKCIEDNHRLHRTAIKGNMIGEVFRRVASQTLMAYILTSNPDNGHSDIYGTGEFTGEFSAVTAPVLSASWLLKRDEKENGLQVELAFCRPLMALIAARVLRYKYTVSSPRVEDASGKAFAAKSTVVELIKLFTQNPDEPGLQVQIGPRRRLRMGFGFFGLLRRNRRGIDRALKKKIVGRKSDPGGGYLLNELLQGFVAQELVPPFRDGLLQMGLELLPEFHRSPGG
ncbi:phosphate transporter PHO1-like protein 9 [Senna tora]|uniref:Phosphate transporter PHO1-like protein 9 n=1 Tax=Senna tora TaxID=362788 RepID=A0A834VYP8_9FABA|nr:phosphate transporter PHO1-like protein 9 [Senna tora]